MGKLICDSTASSPVIPWRDPIDTPSSDLVDQTLIPQPPLQTTAASSSWENVPGLEEQQKRHLTRLYNKGVLWKHPQDKNQNIIFRLMHGGEWRRMATVCSRRRVSPWVWRRRRVS
ncbi:UNVERIFIED_CONTAM: hypothetical protein Scaly_0907700 [Sesamum calycinum]|uniref:Uncharacterized protein n=1 Tax=Sesamum calycinum TaxID=2727403 RepID=A0AAW2QWW1_9LAMI